MKFRHTTGWALLTAVVVMATACTRQPPVPQWQVEAQSASERAVRAYLRGQGRVAEVEWRKAFDEVAATGQAAQMARMALLQCAAQTAALELTDCPAYQTYAAGAAPAEQAYARYLQAAHTAADVALLPVAQQAVAKQLLAGGTWNLPAADAGAPLSLLTAAGVALRAGALPAPSVLQAGDVAGQQGWRRAAMAWLLLAQRQALAAGDTNLAQTLALRLRILESGDPGTEKSKK